MDGCSQSQIHVKPMLQALSLCSIKCKLTLMEKLSQWSTALKLTSPATNHMLSLFLFLHLPHRGNTVKKKWY